MNFEHSKFIASEGEAGWYTTVVDNEIIDFTGMVTASVGVNGIIIQAFDVPLVIKINDNPKPWHIDANDKEGIGGMPITKIQVLNPTGTKIRWKALTY